MKAASDKSLISAFVEDQMKRLAKDKDVPDENDYRESVKKALEKQFGVSFPAEEVYNHVTGATAVTNTHRTNKTDRTIIKTDDYNNSLLESISKVDIS